MKILYIITGLGLGGAERQLIDLSNYLHEKNHDIKIIYLTGAAELQPSSPSIELVPLNINKSNPLSILKGIKTMVQVIKTFKPDVVHSHMVHANLISRLVKCFIPISRLINTAHSTNEGGRIPMFLYRLSHNVSDLTTHVSQDGVKQFELKHAVPKNSMRSIYNGIDMNHFVFDPKIRTEMRAQLNISNQQIIMVVARLVPEKNHEGLINAFSLLLKEQPQPISLYIVGNGPLLAKLQQQTNALNLSQSIYFLGNSDKVTQLLCAADIVVLPSFYEGFGLVLAEAMACERIVITTNTGATSEVVGDCGFIVDSNTPQALSNSLTNALALSNEEREILGKQARARIQRLFSLEHVAKQWLDLYSQNTK